MPVMSAGIKKALFVLITLALFLSIAVLCAFYFLLNEQKDDLEKKENFKPQTSTLVEAKKDNEKSKASESDETDKDNEKPLTSFPREVKNDDEKPKTFDQDKVTKAKEKIKVSDKVANASFEKQDKFYFFSFMQA